MRVFVILTLFLALTTAFALYTVYYTQGLPTTKEVTQVDATYQLRGGYQYVATLAPNLLYNGSVLDSGNGSLFVSITKTIDVTYTWSLFTSKPGSAQLGSNYVALLSGKVWNATLDTATNQTQMADAMGATGTQSFLFNITQIHNTIRAAEDELQYVSPAYTIEVVPVVSGPLTVSGQTTDLSFSTPLDLVITDGVISVNGTSSSQNGTLTSTAAVSLPGNVRLGTDSHYFLLGSLIAVGASGTYTAASGRRKTTASGLEEMNIATRPYREIIAASKTAPDGGKQIAMAEWEDLVKVADTLGKPILEYTGETLEGSPLHLFFVTEDGASYTYDFGRARPETKNPPS